MNQTINHKLVKHIFSSGEYSKIKYVLDKIYFIVYHATIGEIKIYDSDLNRYCVVSKTKFKEKISLHEIYLVNLYLLNRLFI